MKAPACGTLLRVIINRVFAEPLGTSKVIVLPVGSSLLVVGEQEYDDSDVNPLLTVLHERHGLMSIFFFSTHFEELARPET